MNRAVVIYSGGLDSTVLLTQCTQEYDEVVALNFNYGSKHNLRERASARIVCKKLGVTFVEIELAFINKLFKSDLLQSGGNIPEGHYEAESMKSTVVPFRNGIMLSIAAGYAESIGANQLLLATHAGDHAIYPDTKPEFNLPMCSAIWLGTDMKVVLDVPFSHMTKADIVKKGIEIGAPLELSWSCYKGGDRPCLRCGTDMERTEAFLLNNVKDPALSDEEWDKAVRIISKKKD